MNREFFLWLNMATLWAFLAYLIGSNYFKLETPPPPETITIEKIVKCPDVTTKSLQSRVESMTRQLGAQHKSLDVIIKSQLEIMEFLKYQEGLED